MGTVGDKNVDEESMSDVEFEDSEDQETDDDDDDEDDDDEYFGTSGDGQSDTDNEDTEHMGEDVDVPRVVRKAPSRKPHGGHATDKVELDNIKSNAGRVMTSEQEYGEVGPGKIKRRRMHGKRDCQQVQDASWEDLAGICGQDWDEGSEDGDWSPMDIIMPPSVWFCTNCSFPNQDELLICGKCDENRKSGILIEGHLASATVPLQSPRAFDAGANTIAHGKDSSSRVFPVDSRAEYCKTVIGFDERMLLHEETSKKSHPHPERPDRLRAIIAGLAAEGLFPGRCARRSAREVSRSELEKVHSQGHVDSVEKTCKHEISYFTPDTYANKDSSLAARLAAGISADLATAIVKGEAQNGFALVRPPGHHAEGETVMGFCLHNNAGVAAKAAQAAGARKVLIVDWDVHHGNGTQDIFAEDPSVLYVSLHRYDFGKFYPGTGAADEVGKGKGKGSSVNIPWICGGMGDNDYIFAFIHIVLPIARKFAPDMTIISAGFDAARGDPLGGCKVTPSGYAHMTSMLNSVADGKMLVILEGGYNLRSISASTTAVIKVLLGDSPGPLPIDVQPTEAGGMSMLDVFEAQCPYWPSLRMPEILEHIAHLAQSNNHRKEPLLGELDQKLASSPSVQLGQPIGSPA